MPIIQKWPAPILFPQALPAPCPGYTTILSSNVIILFLNESYNIAAKSSLEIESDTAKSGLPTSFKNKVSPVKTY